MCQCSKPICHCRYGLLQPIHLCRYGLLQPICLCRYGLLQPISAAEAPWKRVITDFIVNLTNSAGFDAIMVVVDKNTKLAHFISMTKAIDAKGVASLYL